MLVIIEMKKRLCAQFADFSNPIGDVCVGF